MVVFDATILLPLFSANVPAPIDRKTGSPVDRFRDRVDYLIQQLDKDRSKIVIPTPALSEILVRSGSAGAQYLAKINSSAVFRTVPFHEMAAVEVAAMTLRAIEGSGDKRGGGDGIWAKLKFDRQIVAIAKVEGAKVIYSDDDDIFRFGAQSGLTVIRAADLPLPPDDP